MYVKYESQIVRTKRKQNKNSYSHKTTIKPQQPQFQSPLSLPNFHFYGSFAELPIVTVIYQEMLEFATKHGVQFL